MEVTAISGVARLRRANKAEVAEFFDVAIKTVDGWTRRGCPVIHRGGKTDPWVFDLLHVAEWKINGNRQDGDVDPDTMPPADRKAWYDSEKKRLEVGASMKELIPSQEIEEAIPRAFAALMQDLRAIPDNLERRYGVSAETAEMVERCLFEVMDGLADRMSRIGPLESEQ